MASKVLKTNNKKSSAKKLAQPKIKSVANSDLKKKMRKLDLDYSTARLATVQNENPLFITFFVYDNVSESDICFCEHRDYIAADVREALKDAGIKV